MLEETLDHDLEKRSCIWWRLAIEYAGCRLAHEDADADGRAMCAWARQKALDVVARYTYPDSHVQDILAKSRVKSAKRLHAWQDEASALWTNWNLSDGEEFFASRSGVLLDLLSETNT